MINQKKNLFKKLLKKKNFWLVTGVAGFIGSNLLEILIENNQMVIGIDDLSSGKIDNIAKFINNDKKNNFIFIRKNINQLTSKDLLGKKIDYTIHLAAMTSVTESIKFPKKCIEINENGFEKLILNLLKIKTLKKVIYASSAAVYGNSPSKNSEKSILKPLSPYAFSKINNEKRAKFYSKRSKIKFIGFRFFNIFGKNQNPRGEYSSVISKWVGLLKKNKKVDIYGNGQTTRDFCHVNNVIFFILSSINKKLNNNEIFNLASGRSITLNKLAHILILKIKKKNNYLKFVNYKNFKEGDIFRSKSNIEKAIPVCPLETCNKYLSKMNVV